mgnify:CR=1 FL=1
MDKRVYLPAIASLLILCMLFASFTPSMAVALRARAEPKLEVVTIAEDDEVRKLGVIVLNLSPKLDHWDKPYDKWCYDNPKKCQDKLSQHKILVTFNGVPVTFSYSCQFVKKEKLHPLQKPQFKEEQLRTVLTDESANFVCKLRSGKPGVGVLDVYYLGPQEKQFIADYIMVVTVWTRFGGTTVWGTEIQDVCVLGWAMDTNTMIITKPDGTLHFSWPDPLGPFVGCEEAALWQRDNQGLPVLYD